MGNEASRTRVVYISEFVNETGASTAFSRRSKALAQGLAVLGADVILTTDEPEVKAQAIAGVRLVRVHSLRGSRAYKRDMMYRVLTALTSSRSFARLFEQFQPQVVIASFHEPLHSFCAILAARLQGKPAILDAQDSWLVLGQTHHGRIRNTVRKTLERTAMQAADIVTTVTPTLGDIICASYRLPRDKVEVVYNGADLPREIASQKKDIDVIHLGSPREYYDTLAAVDALGRIRSSGIAPNIVFLGCVDDEYVVRVRRKVEELDMTDQFRFLPPVPPDQVGQWLDRSVVALHTFNPNPIFRCAIGVKVFEYLAHGVPVVHHGPTGGETARLITEGKCGIVVDSMEGLGTAIVSLLRDVDRRSALSSSARAVATSYTWARSSDAMNALVQRLALG